MSNSFLDWDPRIQFLIIIIGSFLFVALIAPSYQERDDLGCLKTVTGDTLDHQCRTAKLLEKQLPNHEY